MPLLDGLDGRQVTHVGVCRIRYRGQPDAVEAPLRPGLVPPLDEFCEETVFDPDINHFLIVAGIEQRPARRTVGKGFLWHQVPAEHFQMVKAGRLSDAYHDAFESVEALRTTEPTNHTRRRFVGHHQAIGNRQVGYIVGTGHHAVLTI